MNGCVRVRMNEFIFILINFTKRLGFINKIRRSLWK